MSTEEKADYASTIICLLLLVTCAVIRTIVIYRSCMQNGNDYVLQVHKAVQSSYNGNWLHACVGVVFVQLPLIRHRLPASLAHVRSMHNTPSA